MAEGHLLLLFSDPGTSQWLVQSVLRPAGYQVDVACDPSNAEAALANSPPDLVLIGETLGHSPFHPLAESLLEGQPQTPLILVQGPCSPEQVEEALRFGFADVVQLPCPGEAFVVSIQEALNKRQRLADWASMEALRRTQVIRKRLDEVETLLTVEQKIAASLDEDHILEAVIESAVELSGAEESTLFLLDKDSGELKLRASWIASERLVRIYRSPGDDIPPDLVVHTHRSPGQAENNLGQIRTSRQASTLMYFPLVAGERVIGILGINNPDSQRRFDDDQLGTILTLADFTAGVIENAHLYRHTEFARENLAALFASIENGLIVLDCEDQVQMMNPNARSAFQVEDRPVAGKPVQEVIKHPDLLEILSEGKLDMPGHAEITLDDGRVMMVQLSPIPEAGTAITMQDISTLKELDLIKTDFVNTVSHDLRSPLTAILGYVELLERTGPINDQQREFIRRVTLSVYSITALINDLLDLGRIEAGFDSRKEVALLDLIIQIALESLKIKAEEKGQNLVVELPPNSAPVLGNPVQLRQMITNLVSNAIQYTQPGGTIQIRLHEEDNQFILHVSDNGPGISPGEQPHIFDKFYRGSNVPVDTIGSGLGLAIVQSIVDNHQGRIWVDSALGKGSTFTVVLPVSDQRL